MVTQNYTISTVKVATPPKVKMSQYDYGMRTITFAVVDGSGAAVDLTGKTVTVEGTRIDGHAFATTCTVADNEATFVDTVDMTNAAGDHPAELVVRQNDERLGTMNFIISVEPAAMDEGADVSPEDKNLFEQLYAKVVSGSPVAVDTVAEMTNTDGVYLYTGNESGYTKGYWYYYDGSAWVAGGAYGSGATDKTLTLSDVAADAKVVGDYLDEISEGILESYVTEGSYTSSGVTTERISDTELKVYGTCTANRRFNVYNGFQTVRTTSSPFQEMLPAGTYRVSLSANKTTGNPRVTFSYTTYADALWTILNGQTVIYEFTQPFMFGFYANTGINYGTADDPTIVTLRIESLTAKDEVARETKADKDGTYPDLTAGQLYTDEGVENTEPYFFRAVPAAASEVRMRKLVGGTVAWNQLAIEQKSASTAFGLTLSISDGKLTLSGTYSGAAGSAFRLTNTNKPIPANHKIFWDSNTDHWMMRLQGMYGVKKSTIYDVGSSTSVVADYVFQNNGYSSGDTVNDECYPQIIDLTLALGSTIADYIYSLETATAGAGVAFFRKYFPESYYPYNAGELKSVGGVSEKVTTGKNLLDPSSWRQGFLSVDNGSTITTNPNWLYTEDFFFVGGNTACLSTKEYSKSIIYAYDANKAFIGKNQSNGTSVVYAGATYVRIGYNKNGSSEAVTPESVIAKEVQLEIGSTATAYESYREPNTYPLDGTLTLRGIPKLADGKMYFDGDEYLADGTVKRRYGVVDLGTLTWDYQSSSQTFYTTVSGSKVYASTVIPNIITAKHTAHTWSGFSSDDKIIGLAAGTTQIRIRDTSYSDAATFKTAMSGVYLVYELATPTTETADPFTESEIIDPYGTEEFVSTGLVPVGHDTIYVDDLKQRLEDIAPPTTDGTYTLQVTVSGGKPTFAWVAANRSLSMGNPFASAAEETEETTEETEEPVEEGDMR